MQKILSVDFDGTLCENEYPGFGAEIAHNIEYMRLRREEGWITILNTCRSGTPLLEALAWCGERGIVFDYVNENTPEMIREFGGDCRKIFATEYMDDRNVIIFADDHCENKECPFVVDGFVDCPAAYGCGGYCKEEKSDG